ALSSCSLTIRCSGRRRVPATPGPGALQDTGFGFTQFRALSRAGVVRVRERGFTLLEVAVTMLIIALLLAIAIPRLPRIGRTDLEASADRLASTMSYLADEASLRGRIYRLTLRS